MNEYLVAWYIDIEADTSLEAAKMAMDMQRDKNAIATIFTVKNKRTKKSVTLDAVDGDILPNEDHNL